MSLRDRSIPVFIYPCELTFYVGTQSTHKQLFSLFNPYEFPVKYQVFSNAGDKYVVIDPKGSIAARACIDLLVRHSAPFPANCHSRDKFMIIMNDAATNQLLGKRYVPATLLPGEKESGSVGDESSQSYSVCDSSQIKKERPGSSRIEPSLTIYLIILSVVFTALLMLPTNCDQAEQTIIPSYLHLTVPVKIIFGYFLGVISCLLFRMTC